MAWFVGILPGAEDDLQVLFRNDEQRMRARRSLADEFEGLKGERVSRLLTQGARTKHIDRLAESRYPGSIRIQLGDHRATVFCIPPLGHAFVTHVFHKSHDPHYKKAVATHDARIGHYVATFTDFARKR